MADGDTFLKRYGLIVVFIAVAAVIAAAVNAAGSFFSVGPEWRLAVFALLVVVIAFVFGPGASCAPTAPILSITSWLA